MTIGFDGPRCRGCSLYNTTPADEPRRRVAHDELLERMLGPPHVRDDHQIAYRYPRGEVWSAYDPRADASSIGVRFAS